MILDDYLTLSEESLEVNDDPVDSECAKGDVCDFSYDIRV